MSTISLQEIAHFMGNSQKTLLENLPLEFVVNEMGNAAVEYEAFADWIEGLWGYRPNELISASELAERAGVSPTIIYRRMDDPDFHLPSIKYAGENMHRHRRYIPIDHIDEWLADLNQLPRLVRELQKQWSLEEVEKEWERQADE